MKAKSIIQLVFGGAIGAYCLHNAYLLGQIKAMRDATKILKDSFENAECEEEKHD
jgi:hypothetical protein